jgi:hypothetical protein
MELKDLSLTLNHLFRYLWGGILLFITFKLFRIDFPLLKELEKSPTFPLIIFISGAFLYVLYRACLTRIIDWLHIRIDRDRDCLLNFIRRRFGFQENRRIINLWRIIRDKYHDKKVVKNFYLQHSEVHMLYLSFFILSLVIIPKIVISFPIFTIELFLGIIVTFLLLLLGLELDLYICHQECLYLMTFELNRIENEVVNAINRADVEVS